MGLDSIDSSKDSNSSSEEQESGKGRAVKITEEEFDNFLENEAPDIWSKTFEDKVGEIIYDSLGLRIDHPSIHLRIYSTIDKDSRVSRPKGDDAIRLVLFDGDTNTVLSGRKKTLRIKTWRKNLREKIVSLNQQWEGKVEQCPSCGSLMTKREGEYGEFFGCTRYPDCQQTKQIEE